MEISAATATAGSSPPAPPVLLRPHATSSATTPISRRASASASDLNNCWWAGELYRCRTCVAVKQGRVLNESGGGRAQ